LEFSKDKLVSTIELIYESIQYIGHMWNVRVCVRVRARARTHTHAHTHIYIYIYIINIFICNLLT